MSIWSVLCSNPGSSRLWPLACARFSGLGPVLIRNQYWKATRGGLVGGGGTYEDSGLENSVFNIVSKNQLRYHVFNTDFYTILWTIQSRPKWLPYS